MTDDLFDDDLFAPRKPAALPPRKSRATTPARTRDDEFIGPRWPVASLICVCGGREEVREPCPDALDCSWCKGLETMRRYVPRYLPPKIAGRTLTAHELRGISLDKV